jgi:hypothetical protein
MTETMLCPHCAFLWGALTVDSAPGGTAPTLAGAPPAGRQASMSPEAGSSSEDDGFECTVCIDDVRTLEGCIWQCREGHVFCAKCYDRMGGNGVPCPSCQVPLSNIRSRLAEKQRAKLQKVQTGRAQLRTGSVANPVDEDAARGALLAQSLQRLSAQEIEGLQTIGRDSPRSVEETARSQEEMMMMPQESLEEIRQTNELAEQLLARSQEDLSSNLSRKPLLKEAKNGEKELAGLEQQLKEEREQREQSEKRLRAKVDEIAGRREGLKRLEAEREKAKYVQRVPLACAEPVVEVDPHAAGTKKKQKRRSKKQSEILLDFSAFGEPIRSEASDKSPDCLGGGKGGKAGEGRGGISSGAPAAKTKMKEASTEKRLKTPTTETAGQHVRQQKPEFPEVCCGNAECRKPLLMPLRCAQCRAVAYCTKECQVCVCVCVCVCLCVCVCVCIA